MNQLDLTGTSSTARFAPLDRPDQPYRLHLSRCWGSDPARRVVFVMLNPSTATAETDDPTIRRCIGFAKSWGYEALDVVNLFALRATNPEELARHRAPVAPQSMPNANDHAIVDAATAASRVICAWGNHGDYLGRGAAVLGLLRRAAVSVEALSETSAGHPGHPLYLKKDLLPQTYTGSQILARRRP